MSNFESDSQAQGPLVQEIHRPRTPKFIAAGAALSMILTGCSTAGEAINDIEGRLTVAAMGDSIDYTKTKLCAKPPEGTPERVVEHVAEQCEKYGSSEAQVMVIDLTNSPKKTKGFMSGLQASFNALTDGHITIDPQEFDVSEDTAGRVYDGLKKPDTAEPCADIYNPSTMPSNSVLEANPSLKEVPYVVVLSDTPSCDKVAAGVNASTNTIDLFTYGSIENTDAISTGAHELGHLVIGLQHAGTITPKEFSSNSDVDTSRYTLTKEDLDFFGVIDPFIYAKYADYEEYIPTDSTDSNVMGTGGRDKHLTLMPHQADQLHWRDEYVGQQYSPKVRVIGKDVEYFAPANSNDTAGLAMLEENIVMRGRREGLTDEPTKEFNAVLIQPVTGFDGDMGKVVESVYISLVNTDGGRTAMMGYLTDELDGERSWAVRLGPNKVLELSSVYGDLQASVKS